MLNPIDGMQKEVSAFCFEMCISLSTLMTRSRDGSDWDRSLEEVASKGLEMSFLNSAVPCLLLWIALAFVL